MNTTAGQTMKVHQAIARCLADNGVTTIFGLMGDGNMFMCDSFIRDCGGEFISTSHEVGAALMALGYSTVDLGKRLGVASVTHGPGMVNTVTALLQGVKSSTPMLLICGDVKVEDRLSLQKAPQRELAMAVGAGWEQIRSPKTAATDTAMAMRRAILERRPVVLNAPIDFDWAEVEYKPVRVHIPDGRAVPQSSDDLDNAIGMIAAAKRPVIVAGRGASSPEARASILRLAKRIEAPMAQTLKAKDLFRGEDFDLGICGVESTEPAVETILGSDCLIFFGASITKATSSMGAFVKDRRVIQINQEPDQIGKNFQPDVGVVGDPGGVADLIVHWLDEAEIPPSGGYTEDLKHKLESYRFHTGPDADYDNGTVDYRHALVRLEEIFAARSRAGHRRRAADATRLAGDPRRRAGLVRARAGFRIDRSRCLARHRRGGGGARSSGSGDGGRRGLHERRPGGVQHRRARQARPDRGGGQRRRLRSRTRQVRTQEPGPQPQLVQLAGVRRRGRRARR